MLATSRCCEVNLVGSVQAASDYGIQARRTPPGRYPPDPATIGRAITITITGADREWQVHLRPAGIVRPAGS